MLKMFTTCDVICGIFILINVLNSYFYDSSGQIISKPSFIGRNVSEELDTHNIAIIRVGFVNNDGTEMYSFCDNECLAEKMWTNEYGVNNYFLDSSDGKFSFDKNNSIIISVQINKTASNKTAYDKYSKFALKELQNQYNINIISKYRYRMFIYPVLGYDWEGLANLGCWCDNCMSWITIPAQSECINNRRKCGNTLITNVMIHELFHNIGLYHSSTDYNNDDIIDNEYGDISDVMGGTDAYYPSKLNFPHLFQLGWINEENILFDPVSSIDNVSSIVTLTPISYKQSSLKDSEFVGIIINNKIFISYKTENSDSFDSNLLDYDSIYVHKFNGRNTMLIKKIRVQDEQDSLHKYKNMNIGLSHLRHNVMINITDVMRI